MIADETFRGFPYGLPPDERRSRLLDGLGELHRDHLSRSAVYQRVCAALWPQAGRQARFDSLEQLPWLPVGLFKTHLVSSVAPAEVTTTLTSSGTTGQAVSRIVLDAPTSRRQQYALSSILGSVLGPKRVPMLIIDTASVVRDRRTFSARGAGVLGLMRYGREHVFALRDDMSLDDDAVAAFLARHGDAPFAMFGFTFMVWKYFLGSLPPATDLSNGILIHSGGWKKLIDEAVDNATFRRTFEQRCGLRRIHNFYGMVEQVGSVFLEGDDALLHAPAFADVIIRDPRTLMPLPAGEAGLVQVVSLLPSSYPGHSLLTEDLGTIVDDGGEGPWFGTRFVIHGRLPRAELRGCSDTHAAEAAA